MNFDETIKKIVALRDESSELTKQLEALKEQRALLENDLMNAMSELGMSQAGSSAGTATLKKVQKPVVVDWNSFEAYVKTTDNFQLYQRRISPKAYAELADAGETVEGVQVIEQFDVSIRRKTTKSTAPTYDTQTEE